MEGFLSLPRSAKGGIAILLAVALLGWAIVAYSAKRQHDDARSLDNAIATLKSQKEREETTLSERNNLEERLAAAESELAASRDAIASSRQEKREAEARLAELESGLDAAQSSPEITGDQGGALALLEGRAGTDDGRSGDAGERAQVNADGLRSRLTETMTALSAKNATLQQRERELERALEDIDAADAGIETLAAAASERDALRDRLTGLMTTLSARSAMLQQRERELEASKAERGELEASIAALETSLAEQEEAGRSLDALNAELERTKQAVDDGAEALQRNQAALADREARLRELDGEQAAIDAAIAEKRDEVARQEQKLAAVDADVGEEEQRLAERRREIETAEAELADLRAAEEEKEAASGSLVAEIEGLEATLNDREDALGHAGTELDRLKGEIAGAEQQLAEMEAEIDDKRSLLNARNVEIQGVEASLAALKSDRAQAETETVELKTAINRQEEAIQDLAALKDEIGEAKVALARQAALLEEKREAVAAADARIAEATTVSESRSSSGRSLPQIPIAALSQDDLAVLPIDPTQEPYPVQTKNGIRLALVHFDLGSAELTPGGLRRAKEAAAWIKKQGVDKIRLVGATDTVGTKEDNMALAKRRAQSLLDAFAAEGIDPDRIELISKGEAGGGEVIDDQTAEPLNRCVGVFIGG